MRDFSNLRHRANSGAIEGMPLMMIIIIVVAVAVLAIVLGWIFLAGDSDPMIKEIEVDPEEVVLSDSAIPQISVTVWDDQDNKVDGAIVTCSGCNVAVEPMKLSGGTGVITLTGIDLPPGSQTGTLTLVAEKSGMGKKTLEVVVVKSLG